MSQAINSNRLHCSQIKVPPLHQGQLLHNGLLANHLTDDLLLNLSTGMANKAQGHISSPLSSGPEHRFSSLSSGRDRVGLSCQRADLEVCESACVIPPPGPGWEGLRMSARIEDKEWEIVGKLTRENRNPNFFNIRLPFLFLLCQYTLAFKRTYSHHMW